MLTGPSVSQYICNSPEFIAREDIEQKLDKLFDKAVGCVSVMHGANKFKGQVPGYHKIK